MTIDIYKKDFLAQTSYDANALLLCNDFIFGKSVGHNHHSDCSIVQSNDVQYLYGTVIFISCFFREQINIFTYCTNYIWCITSMYTFMYSHLLMQNECLFNLFSAPYNYNFRYKKSSLIHVADSGTIIAILMC